MEGKLFDNLNKSEPPKTNLSPLYPYLGMAPGSFPVPTLRIHRLCFPTYDGREDPLPWVNRCEQFFRG